MRLKCSSRSRKIIRRKCNCTRSINSIHVKFYYQSVVNILSSSLRKMEINDMFLSLRVSGRLSKKLEAYCMAANLVLNFLIWQSNPKTLRVFQCKVSGQFSEIDAWCWSNQRQLSYVVRPVLTWTFFL